MSRFVSREDTDEITLADGDRAWVRQRLTAPESAMLRRSLVRFRVNTATGKMESEEGDWHLSNINIVKAYLVRWTFTGADGQVRPVTSEAIDELDEDTIDELAGAINDLQRARQEERQKKVKKS